tara:strand:+ start:152 stop:754 length:603 start_codon:yes stop_codon:yes gene_type:complete
LKEIRASLFKKNIFTLTSMVFCILITALCISSLNAEEAESLSIDDTMKSELQRIEPYIKERFKNWKLKCVKPMNSTERCEANQIIYNKNEQPVAEISIYKLPKNQVAAAAATIIVPLETVLSDGLILKIEGFEAKKYHFKFCNSLGCYSQIGLTEDEVEKLKKKEKATIFLKHIASGDQQIVIPMSLAGFTKTFSKATQP